MLKLVCVGANVIGNGAAITNAHRQDREAKSAALYRKSQKSVLALIDVPWASTLSIEVPAEDPYLNQFDCGISRVPGELDRALACKESSKVYTMRTKGSIDIAVGRIRLRRTSCRWGFFPLRSRLL